MSSLLMTRTVTHLNRKLAALSLAALVGLSAPAQCQDGAEWDRARTELIANQPAGMQQAIARWRELTTSDAYGFDAYAGFLLAYPGFPEEWKLRLAAEKSLAVSFPDPARLAALFDRFPPLTNPARAQYALALATLGRAQAADVAHAAWRGGSMSDGAEAALLARFGTKFTAADHDARIDALLWDGNAVQAFRQIAYASAGVRPLAMARLAYVQGKDPAEAGPAETRIAIPPEAMSDAGYVVNRARYLMHIGQAQSAAYVLANRPQLAAPALDQRKWVAVLLAAARSADPETAAKIALGAQEGFGANADISQLIFPIRDDYTSLMWLGGSKSLFTLGQPARAAQLFYRYAGAARTPQSRAKGYYWAGRALATLGDTQNSGRYFEAAAAYPDQFYGQLALERLGRPQPDLHDQPTGVPTSAERAAFLARPLTLAVRDLARDGDWQTTIRFFREICARAETPADHVLVADLAHALGRRDLAVVLGQDAGNDGLAGFRDISFPVMPVPSEGSWTMIHAITRQESQFSQNAVSRTGARGLMQLMPGTAAEQSHKLGLAFSAAALTADPTYNVRLGDYYFGHLMDIYGGSYPLAGAAYNAGPGNVARWLRANGDPRQGGIDWVQWIENIPVSETRGYVQHVIENAVVYEALYPARASYHGPNPTSHFIGKQAPG